MMFRALIFCLLPILLVPEQLDAQIFRGRLRRPPSIPSTPDCPGGVCPPTKPDIPPADQPRPATNWFSALSVPSGHTLTSEESEAVRSWAYRAVRIINGNACGTGSLCGRDDEYIYIMTNAHVASSRIGNEVQCEALLADKSGTEKFIATVMEAAYSAKSSTDWALLKADSKHMQGINPIRLSTEYPTATEITGTWGCPRCQVPSGQLLQTVEMSGIWRWQPNSIPGQSGSAVVQGGKQVGLLTWTTQGNGAGQFAAEIYKQSMNGTADGPPRPRDLLALDPAPHEDLHIVFSVQEEDLIEGYHSESTDRSPPIWATPNGLPKVKPQEPKDELTDEERRIIRAMRERGVNWVELIRLILELIDLIQKSRS